MAEGPCFQRGDHTLKVPMSLFAENRQRLVERLRKNPKIQNFANCYVLLQGGQDVPFNDTDVCFIFRQVRKIFYILQPHSLPCMKKRICFCCYSLFLEKKNI